LADQASADEPSHRPTARAFAAALSAAFPDAARHEVAEPPPQPSGSEEQTDVPENRRGRVLLVAGTALVVGVLGISALAVGAASLRVPRPEVGAAPVPDDATRTPDPSPTEASSTTVARTAPPTEPSGGGHAGEDPAPDCPEAVGPVADLDGDGCREALSVDGTVVSTDAGRFQVGEDGDEVVLGDWDCDGSSTPALFRPGTGDVFAFERWANQDDEVSTVALERVAEGTGIRVEREGRCDRLVVSTPGEETTISVDGNVHGAS